MAFFSRDPLPQDVRDEVDRFWQEFEQLRLGEQPRIQRMIDYREENDLARELDVEQDLAWDYGRGVRTRNRGMRRHRFQLPYGRALTVKHQNRIAARLPDVVVDRRDETPQERYRSDTMEKIVWGIIRHSNGESQIASGAWDSSEVGAACFETYFDPQRMVPYFKSIDPETVIPVRGFDDPHNFDVLYRFWEEPLASFRRRYAGKSFRGIPIDVDKVSATRTDGVKEYVLVVNVCTKERSLRFVGCAQPMPIGEQLHNYGFVPYVVIPNLGPERRVWGWADYEFVRALVRYIPVLHGREADILRMVANGAMQVSGSKQSTEIIKRILSEGGIVPLGKDGKIEPIQVPDVPNFAESHADRTMTMLKELGFAPDAAWGAGNAGSGSDRGLQLGPLFELTQMKQVNWSAGLSRLAAMLFKMVEAKTVGKAVYRGVTRRGARAQAFSLQLGPDQQPLIAEGDDGEAISLPRTPKELFDNDFLARFVWQNRVDPDDPAFVASELNKFAQGIQSLRTTLENLGCQNPEDEIKLIEDENERHPWLREGMIKLLEMQLAQQGQGQGAGGGGDQRSASDLAGNFLDGTQTKDGVALDADAGVNGLRGGIGTLYGGA